MFVANRLLNLSLVPVCTRMLFTVGCAARYCGFLSDISQTISLGEQYILVFLMLVPFTSLTAKSPTRARGPVVSFPAAFRFQNYLPLLCEDERISRSSDGEPGSCSSQWRRKSGYHSSSHFPGKLFILRLCTERVSDYLQIYCLTGSPPVSSCWCSLAAC